MNQLRKLGTRLTVQPSRKAHRLEGRVVVVLLCVLISGLARAEHPLQPVDTSSPRATIESFLTLTEQAARRYSEYRDSPSPVTQDALWQLTSKAERLFDLSQVPPATQPKVADETFYLLWELLARIELPDLATIPDASAYQPVDGEVVRPTRWRIPGTEIAIARVEEGVRTGDFLFSSETVRRAPAFYEDARGLPYLHPMTIENVYRIHQSMTGWMIPMAWVEALPGWATEPVLGQVLWKWVALLLVLGLASAVTIAVFRWVQRKSWDGSFRSFLSYLCRPIILLVSTLSVCHFAIQQINVSGAAAKLPDLILGLVEGVVTIWIIWITARWIAGVIVASPREISLIRLTVRAIGFLAVIVVGFRTANNLGIPVYGLIAGAGVGGLGIALAARSTLENFLGTLNLYADRPVQVGDFCRYGEDPSSGWLRIGTVEEIGLRSTRIRGIDRTVTTIPNAEFSNMHIVNLTERDRMMFRTTLALRYETTPDQLRLVLVKFREMLVAHPRVTMAPARVRAVGFGEYSLNVEIYAYVDTSDWSEFLAVQEDLILRIMDIIEYAGTAFAFPSRTLYHGRDSGLDAERGKAAAKQVRDWADARELPFPDFSAEHRKEIRNTLDYPPKGSVTAEKT